MLCLWIGMKGRVGSFRKASTFLARFYFFLQLKREETERVQKQIKKKKKAVRNRPSTSRDSNARRKKTAPKLQLGA